MLNSLLISPFEDNKYKNAQYLTFFIGKMCQNQQITVAKLAILPLIG